jgi:4'-phosphopantetheinyl transferase
MKTEEKRLKKMYPQTINYWEEASKISKKSSRKAFSFGHEIHVWKASLENFKPYFYEKLSKDEKIVANRFRFPRDQYRYITSHYILRHVLGSYINCDASLIEIESTKFGKPFLNPKYGNQHVYFNLTHSQDLMCLILSKRYEVGIDLEYMNKEIDWLKIANVYYSNEEVFFLKNMPKSKQLKEFYNLWTKKEAMLKTLGTGLAGLENLHNSLLEKNPCFLHFNCNENYQGTLAINAILPYVRFFHLKE